MYFLTKAKKDTPDEGYIRIWDLPFDSLNWEGDYWCDINNPDSKCDWAPNVGLPGDDLPSCTLIEGVPEDWNGDPLSLKLIRQERIEGSYSIRSVYGVIGQNVPLLCLGEADPYEIVKDVQWIGDRDLREAFEAYSFFHSYGSCSHIVIPPVVFAEDEETLGIGEITLVLTEVGFELTSTVNPPLELTWERIKVLIEYLGELNTTLGDIKSNKQIKVMAFKVVLEMEGNRKHPTDDLAFKKFVKSILSSKEEVQNLRDRYGECIERAEGILLSYKDRPCSEVPKFVNLYAELIPLFSKGV